jgi:dsRNA-specific ribonuclease
VLADACEALVASIYLDGGFEAAFQVVRHLFAARVDGAAEAGSHDYKTRLQERAARKKLHIRYLVVDERGPDHDKTFEVAATISERELARGVGKTKKEAEQRAAELALRALDTPPAE